MCFVMFDIRESNEILCMAQETKFEASKRQNCSIVLFTVTYLPTSNLKELLQSWSQLILL